MTIKIQSRYSNFFHKNTLWIFAFQCGGEENGEKKIISFLKNTFDARQKGGLELQASAVNTLIHRIDKIEFWKNIFLSLNFFSHNTLIHRKKKIQNFRKVLWTTLICRPKKKRLSVSGRFEQEVAWSDNLRFNHTFF